MTAVATKPRKPRSKKFHLGKTIAQLRSVGRRTSPKTDHVGESDFHVPQEYEGAEFDKVFAECVEEVRNNPVQSPLELKVTDFFIRLERVTVHVLDRISTLALKGAAYIDNRG